MIYKKAINPQTGDWECNSPLALTYGLNHVENAILNVLFPYDFEVLNCTDNFSDLLAIPCACMVVAPDLFTTHQRAALNELYKEERETIILFNGPTDKTFSFTNHEINLLKRRNVMRDQAFRMIKSNGFPCFRNCDGFMLNDGFVLLDMETTGLNPVIDEIISITAVRIANYEVADRFKMLIKPEYPIPENIEELTEITNEMVASERPLTEAFHQFMQWYPLDPLVVYNGDFDFPFLDVACLKCGVSYKMRGNIDLLPLLQRLYGNLMPRKRLHEMKKIVLEDATEYDADIDTIAQLFIHTLHMLRTEYEFRAVNDLQKLYLGERG